MNDADVVVVGAGLTGLAAARALESRSRYVTVLDKGRSVGGRLATRRLEGARLDHGAQFFTQRGPAMESLVEELLDEEVAIEWCRGFGSEDGHPRYRILGGMNGLAKYLAEPLEDVRCGVQVTEVAREDRGWVVRWDGGELRGGAVLLTAPVPQSLAVLDGPSAVPEPGGAQLTDGPFTWVADNSMKGISDLPAVTLHTDHATAMALFDEDEDVALAELLALGAEWFGGAEVVDAQLKKWRYATPRTTWDQPICVAVDGDWPLVLAGDAFDGPKVEGAYCSGLAAAERLRHSGVDA